MNNDYNNILNKEDDNQNGLNDLNDALINDDVLLNEDGAADFDSDAADGLKDIAGNKIPTIVNEINSNLKTQLKNKKRSRKSLPDQSAVLITIITLLLLVVLAYLIIKKFY